MRRISILVIAVAVLIAGFSVMANDAEQAELHMKLKTKSETKKMAETTTTDFKQIPFKTIDGKPTNLAAYDGKVKLIVNVASKCGFTPQYDGLEKIYEEYKDKGFVVIGFPANNFNHQEPGTNAEIKKFCTSKFNVTFPMMAKISVKGDDIHPLYQYLTTHSMPPGDITWNFNKFLLDRDGNIVARWESTVEPTSKEITQEIEKVLTEEAPKS